MLSYASPISRAEGGWWRGGGGCEAMILFLIIFTEILSSLIMLEIFDFFIQAILQRYQLPFHLILAVKDDKDLFKVLLSKKEERPFDKKRTFKHRPVILF